jgi:hypothetical protein
VLSEWLTAFGKNPKPSSGESQQRRGLLNSLIDSGDKIGTAFTVSSVDTLRRSDQEWMLKRCIPQVLVAFPDSIFVFTGNVEVPLQGNEDKVHLLQLGTPDSGEVTQYFRRFEDGPQGQIYVDAGVDYGTLKKLATAHELKLAEVTTQ